MTTRFKGQQHERRSTHEMAKQLAARLGIYRPRVMPPHHLGTSTKMFIKRKGVTYCVHVKLLKEDAVS